MATGKSYTVREFATRVFKKVGINLKWKGSGLKEIGVNKVNNKTVIKIHKNYFRPQEVDYLLGDAKKARRILGWKPKSDLNKLIDKMVKFQYKNNF